MPKHLSMATVVEKNRIASPVAFIMLLEVDVTDTVTGAFIETLRLARNNENITYQGEVYTAVSFDFNIEEAADSVPEVTLSVKDPTRTVMARAEQHAGGVGWKVRFKFINTGNLSQPPEIEEMVYIVASKAKTFAIDFTLGAVNPLAQRFPRRLQWRDRCSWVYKGRECGYGGALVSCDYTLQGDNGCAAHGNTKNFGAFPGIRPR